MKAFLVLLVGIALQPEVYGLAGGWQEYPVYEGDPEYDFAFNAINFLRGDCMLRLIPYENFTVYDDECYSSVIDSAVQIILSVEIDDGSPDPSYLYALISSEETVGNIDQNQTSEIAGNFTFLELYDADDDSVKYFCNEGTALRSAHTSRRALTPTLKKPKPQVRYVVSPSVSDSDLAQVPADWDWRDHMPSEANFKSKAAASIPLSQGSCGSCYTFGGVTAMAYRFNIASNGSINAVPSPQTVMTCSNGCEGGGFEMVYDVMRSSPVAADWAAPYTGRVTASCPASEAASMLYRAKNFAGDEGLASGAPDPQMKAVLGERAIMYEVWRSGPGGVYVKVESQFEGYGGGGVLVDRKCTRKGGICQYQSSDTNHACTLIGWGVDSGQKYWLIQNSWGPGWGNNGFLKLERGVNALGVETDGVMVGKVDLSSACSRDVICYNGGSYTKACGCHCLPGWTGTACQTCSKTCAVSASTTGDVTSRCSCVCKDGFTNPTNLLGFPDCGLKALLYLTSETSKPYRLVVNPGGPGTVRFDFGMAFTPGDELSAANKVKKGDMLVAVDVGKVPWTKEADWGTTRYRANVCGAKTWNKEAGAGVPCSDVSIGSLSIASEGVFDIYYVKYNGLSEFGVDKGYGKDFMKLSQQVCTHVNVSKCAEAAVQAQAELNQQLQAAQRQQLADAAAQADAAARDKARAAALAREAEQIRKDLARIAPLSFLVSGLSSEYFGKDERKAIETVTSSTAGRSCGDLNATTPRNCTSRDIKIIRISAAAQTSRRTRPNPGPGAAAVMVNITTLNSVTATAVAQSLTAAITSGRFVSALKGYAGGNTFLSYATAVNSTSPAPPPGGAKQSPGMGVAPALEACWCVTVLAAVTVLMATGQRPK